MTKDTKAIVINSSPKLLDIADSKDIDLENQDIFTKNLLVRLNRVEGQVRGVKRMLKNNALPYDVLIQISAVRAALQSASQLIVENHLRETMLETFQDENDQVIEDFMVLMRKVM